MWLGQRRRRWVAAAAVAGIAGGLPVAAPAKADGVGVVSTTATSTTATSTTAISTTATSTTV
ncbi:MAG TPA: hypothetical protein VHT97_14930, partial [Acidimicrobiales bacterium]|nr:hypothetical protein [Acidimicrobiales bacterium]